MGPKVEGSAGTMFCCGGGAAALAGAGLAMTGPYVRGATGSVPPRHTKGDASHPDAEFGFVNGVSSTGGYFCHFWRKGEPGELRTVTGAIMTPAACLAPYHLVDQSVVEAAIERIREAIQTDRDIMADLDVAQRWYR